MTWPLEQVDAARRLNEQGLNYSQIARALGISRWTIRYWLNPNTQPQRDAVEARRSARECQRCRGEEQLLGADYVYLLGLYLGDGYICHHRRGVWRLRIVQDKRYKGLILEGRLAMCAVTPTRVSIVNAVGCVEITSYWKHWCHLFPQHGPGPKWQRKIAMEDWQRSLIDAYAGQLIRGLIHSDGSRFLNPVTRRWANQERHYSYPRYEFSNASDDIRLLFTEACERIGVRWTRLTARRVAISRREDVALLDTFIGPKC